ncbi:hypothetical protein [Pseudomonas sp. Marseille-QA0892]
MTTTLVPTITDDQLEEVVGRDIREAFRTAEGLGYRDAPIHTYQEPILGGGFTWVLQYRVVSSSTQSSQLSNRV